MRSLQFLPELRIAAGLARVESAKVARLKIEKFHEELCLVPALEHLVMITIRKIRVLAVRMTLG